MRPAVLFAQLLSLIIVAAALSTLPCTSFAGSHSKAEKRQSNRIKIQNTRSGSEERTAERDRRLYRECQGRPNSGACAGYTRR
ncbi:hypothetical protein [Comamonas sp. Y33R10-2]|uniref:hypothetical protein n=1 Tax=Comamonas sp. Y33R10-2 TaxID=2853257 RepID=UPI0021050CA4|nr:hypothetical protein [Comamonas sp. Y33R10-2]